MLGDSAEAKFGTVLIVILKTSLNFNQPPILFIDSEPVSIPPKTIERLLRRLAQTIAPRNDSGVTTLEGFEFFYQ